MKNKDDKNPEIIVWPTSSDPIKNFVKVCELKTGMLIKPTRTAEQIRYAAIKAFNEADSKSTDTKD